VSLSPQIISLLPTDEKAFGNRTPEKGASHHPPRWEVLADLHPLSSIRPLSECDQFANILDNFDTISVSFIEKSTKKAVWRSREIFEFASPTQGAFPLREEPSRGGLRVGLQDLWISGLKLAINLSHRGSDISEIFLGSGVLAPALDIVVDLFAWRRSYPTREDTPSDVSSRSSSRSDPFLEVCL
jgi:hypothetical protein